jgi:hypothetical protein
MFASIDMVNCNGSSPKPFFENIFAKIYGSIHCPTLTE